MSKLTLAGLFTGARRALGGSTALKSVASAVVLTLLATSLTFAQSSKGSLTGVVRDPNGAAVAGATVEATNEANGEKRTATATEDGAYNIPNLEAGTYTVTATGAGFATSTVKQVIVSVSFTGTQDIQLAPAGAQEVVTVASTAGETALNTTDQQISTLISQKKILDLPLLSRDPNSLLLLAPGTTASTSRLGGVTVNGQRERNNNFLVDGIDNNDTDVPGIPGGVSTPNVDATQEFRVITNNFNAEYGRNTGAIINVATKSGTNEFHGGGYIYYRSDKFAARNFFDTSGERDPLQRRQYGASIGGPIKKDRTFFFFNIERDIFDQGIQVLQTVPSAAARQGIFNLSNVLDSDTGLPIGIIDARPGSVNNQFGFEINPELTKLLNQLYPLGNSPADSPLPGVFDAFRFTTQTNDRQKQISTRVDHQISEKHSLTGSFAYSDGSFEFCCESFPGADDAIRSPQTTFRLSTNLVSTLSPNKINEFRFGGNRLELVFAGEGDGGVSATRGESVLAALDRAGSARENSPRGGVNGSLINLAIAGITAPTSGFGTQFRFTGTTHVGDSFTWIKGNHSFKMGGEFRWVYSNGASNFFRQESIDFNTPTNFGFPVFFANDPRNLDADPDNDVFVGLGGQGGTVQNFASYLYGLVAFQTQSQYFDRAGSRTDADYRGYRQRELEVFWQDTWKVRSNLTLNYGVRYSRNGVPFEVNGQLSNLVNQDPSGATPTGGFRFELVGKNSGGSSDLYLNDNNNIAPRVGFAYSPDYKTGWVSKLTGGPGQTSIRGGYGVFYDRVFGNLFSNSSANPPFQRDVFNIVGDFLEFVGRPETQDPTPLANDGDFLAPVLFALPGNNPFQSKFAMPYTQSWNFGIQRQFKANTLFEADYVGSKGTNLLRALDGNMTSVTRINAITGSHNTIDPFSTFTNFQNGSLNTAFFQASLNVALGHSTYHAGQFRLTKTLTESRFGLGQIQAAYTISHSIDNAPDPIDPQSGERSFPRDSSGFAGGLGAERGNSGFDVRHRFVGNMVYELPFRFSNRFVQGALGNWTMSGIWQYQSGSPYSIFGFTDSAGTGIGHRADFASTGTGIEAGDNDNSDPRTQTGPSRNLFASACPVGDTNCDGTSTVGRQGLTGRNQFYGPRFNNVDFSLIKRFPFGDEGRYRFTIRADFFNLFNQVNFGKPVNTIASSNFGHSVDTFASRRIQFVGRFDF
ncbi:MAG TPA: TonB-dependent receptor [Pyrinomonadaceae bacterium]